MADHPGVLQAFHQHEEAGHQGQHRPANFLDHRDGGSAGDAQHHQAGEESEQAGGQTQGLVVGGNDQQSGAGQHHSAQGEAAGAAQMGAAFHPDGGVIELQTMPECKIGGQDGGRRG